MSPPTPDTLQPGERIGHYDVVRRLGSGGMGEVYLARDTRLGRPVAIKVLRPDADPELVRRLDREARAASALNHRNVVHVYDVGHRAGDEGPHYVVMEHVEGETLRKRIQGSALPLPLVLEWGAQIADGLAKAHGLGIVHRDLKPENVMVTPDGTVKILDFGLAKLVPTPLGDLEDRATLSRYSTQQGMLVGTIQYMSPEQARGDAADHRSDQFALGLILHELIAGRPAFRRNTPVEVLAAIIERDPEPLAAARRDLPPELDRLVARCLQKEPARRFDDTAELARALRTIAAGPRSAVPALVPQKPQSIADAEILRGPLTPVVDDESVSWSVQKDDKVRTYDGKKLADSIRRGKLTGMELVRRDGATEWQPLYESRIYERLVPMTGKPREVARWRELRGLGGHYSGFVITGAIMLTTQGHLPFWMAFWGIGLASHTFRALPALLELLPGDRELRRPWWRALSPDAPSEIAAEPSPLSPIAAEAGRVRALISARGGDDTERLLAEVDRVLATTRELAARQADLEEQTSPAERDALAAAAAEAHQRLERAQGTADQKLFERQVEVVQRRLQAIDKALLVLDRLRVRREVAEHELKQLRLDLSRGAAGGLDAPELSSRLQFIRHEVDAAEDVEELQRQKA